MPRYKIQAPDGRTLTIEGATPPSDADIDQLFAQQQPSDTEFQGYSEPEKQVIQEPIGTQEERREKMTVPEKVGAYGLRGAQLVGGALPFGWSIPATAATELGVSKLEHQTPEEAKKSVASATAIDAAVTGATLGLPLIGGALKPLAKAGIKAGGKTLAKQVAKPTLSHGIAQLVGNIGERDVKRIIRDKVAIGSGANLDKLYGNAAGKIERLVEGKKDLVNGLYSKAMQEKGIPQNIAVDTKNLNTTIKDILKEFKEKDIAGLGRETSAALGNIKKAIGSKKTLTLDQIKNVKHALHEVSQKAFDEGVGNKFTGLAKRAESAAIEAENTIPGMKELNKEYKSTISAINKLQDITKTKLAEGEIVNSRMPLAGRLMRLKKEDVYGKQLGKLQAIDKIIGKKLGPEYKFMDDLDSALITDKLTKAGKAGLETTGFGGTPKGMIKQAGNLAFMSPIMKARLLSKFGGSIPKGTLSKDISGVFPRLSTIENLIPKQGKIGLLKAPIQATQRNLRE